MKTATVSTYHDLYITLNPAFETIHIKHSDQGNKGFEDFAFKNISPYLDEAISPDNWMFHYRFSDEQLNALPELKGTRCREYFSTLHPSLKRCGIAPRHILPYDRALGLADRGLSPLTPTQDRQVTTLSALMPSSYALNLVRPHFNAYTAIRTSQGVLLFSPTKNGSELFKRYMQDIADRFYRPGLQEEKLDIHLLPAFSGNFKQYADKYDIRKGEADDQAEIYLPDAVLRQAAPCLHYDLTPTWENFERLTLPLNETKLNVSQENYDITCLQKIALGELRPSQIKNNGQMEFTYGDELSMLQNIVENEDELCFTYMDIECEVALILHEDFPGIRDTLQIAQEQEEFHIPDIYQSHHSNGLKP